MSTWQFVTGGPGWGLFTDDVPDEAFSPAPTKPTCPVTYEIKTAEELGSTEEDALTFGGQTVELLRFDETDETFFCRFASGTKRWVPKNWLWKTTHHSFVETGTRWSYCKVCDCDGQFDFESGKFVAK